MLMRIRSTGLRSLRLKSWPSVKLNPSAFLQHEFRFVFLPLCTQGNQSTLESDLRLFFSEPPRDCRDWRTARTCNKGHEGLELRELVDSHELNEFLGGQWTGGMPCLSSGARRAAARPDPPRSR